MPVTKAMVNAVVKGAPFAVGTLCNLTAAKPAITPAALLNLLPQLPLAVFTDANKNMRLMNKRLGGGRGEGSRNSSQQGGNWNQGLNTALLNVGWTKGTNKHVLLTSVW